MMMRVIAFVNPGSGDNKGRAVLNLLRHQIGDENVFDIVADKGPNNGLNQRASDPSMEVRCIVAGGDGTFSWVASAVEERHLSHVRLIVIPLGSGNDMSRALGWGKKFPGLSKITHSLEYLQSARPHKLDVWKLTAVQSEHATHVDDDGIAHGARPLMCNYLSLGADAFVELRFNQLRWEKPEKYKSRLGNMKAHAQVGLKYMCQSRSKKIFVSDHVQSLHVDDELIEMPPYLQALIFLNIPSYGAGTQPWGKLGRKKPSDLNPGSFVDDMFVDDQQFEVIGLRNLKQFGLIKLFGTHGIRIAQGKQLRLELKSDSTPFQVDGEPWEQLGGHITMEAGNKVGVIQGPAWSMGSKKHASFAPVSQSPVVGQVSDNPPEYPPEQDIETPST